MNHIYLDHNATTPLAPEVAQAISECHATLAGNPASLHLPGRRARQALEDAKQQIAEILGAETAAPHADRVVLTSGGTEANHLALRGLSGPKPGHLLTSAIEHPSVSQTADAMAQEGWQIDYLAVDDHGVIRSDELAERLTDQTRLVSVMLGNNETGVLQPVGEIAQICAGAGVPTHTDAVQVVGKLPVHFRRLGATALSCSAHKFHGPAGIGVLLVRPEIPLWPVLTGGTQQAGIRPGTEPVALAVGMAKALELWHSEHTARAARMVMLRDRLEKKLQAGWPACVIHGIAADRLPHTTNVSFPGLDRQELLMALDMAGVACSTGSACASGATEPSPVLQAMGCDERVVRGSIRLSLGAQSTPRDVDQAAERILRICNELRGKNGRRKTTSHPPAPAHNPL